MQTEPVMELTDVERIARQLRLLNEIQTENLVGSWERAEGEDHFFWSDSMFNLHEIPVTADNHISMEEAASLIHPTDVELVQQKRKELEEFGYAEFTLRIVCPDNKVKYIQAREKKLRENDVAVYRGNWMDEAKRREVQQPVLDQNDKLAIKLRIFERAEELSQAGSWQINLETFETIYSDNVYRIYGVPPQSIIPHVDSFRKYIHPEDRAVVLKSQEKAYVEMIPLHLEYRIVRDDGEVRHISQISHLIKNSRGEHILTGNTRDITEQKLLEIQLREANDILALQNELFIQSEQIGQLGTWQVNLNTRKSVYSANLYRIYGVKPQSVTPGLQNFLQFIHPDDREALELAYHKAFEEHIAPDLEFRILRADGKPRTLRQKSRYIKTDGEELLIGIVQDITDQQQKDRLLKDVNEKLALQNEAFSQAEKVAGMGNWTWNLDTSEVFFSDNLYVIYGLKPQSVPAGFDLFTKYTHPEDRKRIKELWGKARNSKEPMTVEFRIIRTDGEVRHLRSRSEHLVTPEGQNLLMGITQDITTEVQMQQQLMERVNFAALLGDTIIDRIIVTDTANNIITWNRSCEQFYKLKKEEVLGRNFFDVLPQLRIQQITDRFKKALNGEAIHVPVMSNMQMQGQSQEVFIVPLKNDQDRVIGVLHVMHDITTQQKLQDQLSARLQFIEKLQESSIDRIMVLDPDLHFQLWNKQCEKYYGLSKENVVGRNILEVFPRFKADPLYRHCLRALEGETVHVPPNERAGLQGYQESYFVPLKNELKEVTGLLWIMHDLTERFIAEQRLRTSETHLRAAQEIAMMGSFEIDLPENDISWSDETYKIFDYPPGEEVTREKIDARIHPDDLPLVHQAFGKIQEGFTEPVDTYFRIITHDQTVKHLHSRTQMITTEQGAPLKVLGIVQDITERKRTEDQLLKQQELLRQAEEIAHLGSWDLDLETNKLLWSDEIFRIYGYVPQSFEPALPFYFETIHPEDRVLLKNAMREATEEAKSFALTCRIFTLDGELRYLHTRGKAIKDAAGKICRVVGTVQDATAQKTLEAELRKRNYLMRTQFETNRLTEKLKNLGSWQWDLKSGKLLWTEKVYELFGLKSYQFIATTASFLELVHPIDRERLRQELQDISKMNPGPLPDYEFRVMVNGACKYMRASSQLTRERIVIGHFMDITQDALLRQELSDKIKQLEEMNEELSSFAFVASHDLREPLRKIQIFSDWLCQRESAKLSPEGLDRFNRIQAAVTRMETLIDDILSYSRLTTANKNFEKLELNAVLENVKSDLQETITETNAVIESDPLPAVKGNASQFAQLFQNLLSNALKYRKRDTPPHVRITCSEVEGKSLEFHNANPNMLYIRISISDNGIGFDEQYSKKIFQMFQRLHGMHEYPGTGMGLAICKKIMEYHGGFISGKGKPGEGAIFDCYIPQHTSTS
jgi:PAS domain S-box-containing protein